jgi:hypothetical protein
MVNQYDDNREPLKLPDTTENFGESFTTKGRQAKLESWNGSIDLTPFKQAEAWPGQSYCLLGNSFDVAIKPEHSQAQLKRAASISSLFKNCVSFVTLKDAMANTKFNNTLSRFERDWLGRMRNDTLIGPAYNERGELVKIAFSVWRRDFLPQAKVFSEH